MLEMIKPWLSLSPTFKALNSHFFASRIPSIGTMQYNLILPGVVEVAAYKMGFDVNRFQVVTVMRTTDDDAAKRIEADTRAVPNVSAVHRNGALVMACTFKPADPILERRVTAAFLDFQPALRTTT